MICEINIRISASFTLFDVTLSHKGAKMYSFLRKLVIFTIMTIYPITTSLVHVDKIEVQFNYINKQEVHNY
ncbi:hypothetical protein OF66_2710 [Seleniivibrio woodruffii]|uniref:Uncharacterized protein n=1 Tax=Seleniivibrio woodruffii TaxID=1078050 RepID=A0A4R1KGN5_9BACT|nr:hypothetical protein C8D98_1038 [Seleniivibrio woodruffii]TVZ37064.1 hypothetical protein OF66_2710 [Seleniivibrio woodruffii]